MYHCGGSFVKPRVDRIIPSPSPGGRAWKALPSWYLVVHDDQAIPLIAAVAARIWGEMRIDLDRAAGRSDRARQAARVSRALW
jgi:hypothetical protein